METTNVIEYKITIERKVTTRYETTTESLAEERHYTDEERETGYHWMKVREKDDLTKKVYTQVAAIGTKEDSTIIFAQTLPGDELNLKQVIGAINDLK